MYLFFMETPSFGGPQESKFVTNTGRKEEEMLGSSDQMRRKLRVLCLHAFRASGEILKKMMGKWPDALLQNFDFDFFDGPFPAEGKSWLQPLYDPPYYEWYQYNEVEIWSLEDCIEYIEDYMMKHGPFDGLLGFSQGAMLAAIFPGMQSQGVAFTKVPKIKFMILISGFRLHELKFGRPNRVVVDAFSPAVECPSLHFIGDKDYLKVNSIYLLDSFVNPVVIHHPLGHSVPKLDEKAQETMVKFIEKIQQMLSHDSQISLRLKAAL